MAKYLHMSKLQFCFWGGNKSTVALDSGIANDSSFKDNTEINSTVDNVPVDSGFGNHTSYNLTKTTICDKSKIEKSKPSVALLDAFGDDSDDEEEWSQIVNLTNDNNHQSNKGNVKDDHENITASEAVKPSSNSAILQLVLEAANNSKQTKDDNTQSYSTQPSSRSAKSTNNLKPDGTNSSQSAVNSRILTNNDNPNSEEIRSNATSLKSTSNTFKSTGNISNIIDKSSKTTENNFNPNCNILKSADISSKSANNTSKSDLPKANSTVNVSAAAVNADESTKNFHETLLSAYLLESKQEELLSILEGIQFKWVIIFKLIF